jgi:hypothetical protein
VQIDADSGAETLRALVEQDDGGSRLGEVALVDSEGRIGPLDTVFYDTLLDENAASHIASAPRTRLRPSRRTWAINRSSDHVDFMIGSAEVTSPGSRATASGVPVLRQVAGRSVAPALEGCGPSALRLAAGATRVASSRFRGGRPVPTAAPCLPIWGRPSGPILIFE